MKRILNLLLVLCLLMSGCQKNNYSDEVFMLEEDKKYSMSNQFETDKGLYFIEEGFLKFTDKSSNKTVIVSNQPNNTKEDYSNPAYIGYMSCVFVHNHKLYTFKQDYEQQTVSIEMSNLDRTDIKILYSGKGVSISSYIRHKDNVYFFISNPIVGIDRETGLKYYTSDGESQLYILNLSEDYLVLPDVYEEGENLEATILQSINDELYYTVARIKNHEFISEIKKCSYDNLTDEKVIHTVIIEGERPSVRFIDGNEIYYTSYDEEGNESLHMYDLAKKEYTPLNRTPEVLKWFENNGKS